MIKIKFKVIFVTIILSIFSITKPVFTQEDYILKNLKIYINIDDMGNVHVIENLTYKFNIESNGITRSIYLKDPSNIDNLKAYEIYPQKKELQIDIFNEIDSFDFRVYNKSKYETKVFRIEYDLKDFINFYKDVSEFSLKLFDKNNKNIFENLDINIYLPKEKDLKNVKAYQHGYLYKNISIKNNKITYNIGKFPSNIDLELRILFPKDFFKNIHNKEKNLYVYEKILNEEKILQNKINKKKNIIKLFNNIGVYILIFEIIGILMILITQYSNKKYNLPRSYNSKLPNDCTPAVVRCLLKYKKINSKDVLITLIDLVRKKYINIEVINKDKKDYKFEIIKEDLNKLNSHEKYLINWIFYSIGCNKVVYLSGIKKYKENKESFIKFKKSYNIWKSKVIKECERYEYFSKNRKFMKYILSILSLIKLVIGSLGLYLYPQYILIGSMSYISSSIILILYIIIAKRSKRGHIEYRKWKNFKRFLLNFRNMKILNLNNKHIWEKYIVYSYSLDIHKYILHKFKIIIQLNDCKYLRLIEDKEFIDLIRSTFKLSDSNKKLFKK